MSGDSTTPFRVAAFYRFAPLPRPETLAETIRALGEECGLVGSVILATEGVNGTIAGVPDAVEALLALLRTQPGLAELTTRDHGAPSLPFARWKVKVKPEIVTMGVRDVDGTNAGTHIAPADWNALIADPDTILIDTRNDYEVALGRFDGAIDPGTRAFGDFPGWFDSHAQDWLAQGKRIAMYCTGGIRCEKSTAFARARGFDEVYHLKGGILAYLAEMEEDASLWRGECFLFDERVSITHGEQLGEAALCPRCGQPVTTSARHACVGCAGNSDLD
jgi:UPF0176 protein